MVDATRLLDEAKALCLEAGELVIALRTRWIEEGDGLATAVASETKSSPTDPVTEADRAAEDLIVDRLVALFPDDGIAGEEGTNRPTDSGVVWHIDPIDGTTNFVYGIPAYAVSIAAAFEGEMLAGAVYNPVLNHLYWAQSGGGAFRNGARLHRSEPASLATSLIATGFSYHASKRRHQAAVMAKLLPDIRDLRRFGSAALDLCAVAAGEVDAYYESGLNLWDYAAGALIATEAGAVVTDLEGDAPSSTFLLAASPIIHGSLQIKLSEAEADSSTDL